MNRDSSLPHDNGLEAQSNDESYRARLLPKGGLRALLWFLSVVTMVAIPFCIRCWSLSQVPDLGEPFDLKTFLPEPIPASENAFTHYTIASKLFHDESNDWMRQHAVPVRNLTDRRNDIHMFPVSRFKAILEGVLELNEVETARIARFRPALDEWRRGTELNESSPFTTRGSQVHFLSEVHSYAPEFVALARIEAMRCEAVGDLAGAWKWHRATIRFGSHINQHVHLAICYVNSRAHSSAAAGIAQWAEYSGATADQLLVALKEVREASRRYQPFSMTIKTDYFLQRQDWLRIRWDNNDVLQIRQKVPKWMRWLTAINRPVLWLIGEPDVLQRIRAQILVNQLSQIDKPLSKRLPVVDLQLTLFEHDASVPMPKGELTAQEINRVWRGSGLSKLGAGPLRLVRSSWNSALEERARQAALEALLAAQAYRRDTGEFPESLDALVPEYLEAVPLDPCDRSGGRLRYRRDLPTTAVVWSVGIDGNDEGGVLDIDVKTGGSADVGFVLKVGEPN